MIHIQPVQIKNRKFEEMAKKTCSSGLIALE